MNRRRLIAPSGNLDSDASKRGKSTELRSLRSLSQTSQSAALLRHLALIIGEVRDGRRHKAIVEEPIYSQSSPHLEAEPGGDTRAMKIFISADIEGVTGISHWDEASLHKPDFFVFQEQMTAEVAAACEGALAAGATEIWVKDGHGTGRNLLASRLPPPTRLIRGWSGHPYQMLQELDETFSAVLMIGYHAAAGATGNPLSHALTKGLAELRINGRHASEFLLNAYTAALLKVPVALVSGDQAVCDDVVAANASIRTVPVKVGVGDSTTSLHPSEATGQIREQVAHALRTDLTSCGLDLPEHFRVELRYKEHTDAYRNAFYPGAMLKDACAIVFETPDYFEVLRFLLFTA